MMLLDLRYHAASLIAVFLALALGLIIGGSLASDETLVSYQENLISRLEIENNALRNKQQEDEDSLSLQKKEKLALENELNQLAKAYINQISKDKKLVLEGGDSLLGLVLEPRSIEDYDYNFRLKEEGELTFLNSLENKGLVVEVPKNSKLWELALFLSRIPGK